MRLSKRVCYGLKLRVRQAVDRRVPGHAASDLRRRFAALGRTRQGVVAAGAVGAVQGGTIETTGARRAGAG